ncbi:zinc finger protein 318 [Osmerus eperlanus]|uniref:zinc finger protein 318 n=1 Tax=Osmerus eperlanus TaxID=29151 RepID=UPI002E139F7F
MYGGRPPPRDEYPPYKGRGPSPRGSHTGPGRPYTRPITRDDRGRPRAPVHHGYHDHGSADTYRRSPPRRRYSSPDPGSDRRPGGEYWGSVPPRERSPSPPRGRIPIDHSLVITVGNERTGSGTVPPRNSIPYDRDYTPRPAYDGPDDHGQRRRSPSRGRSRPQSRSPVAGRSKSRPRSHSGSPNRSRARSRARSKSRPRSHSRSRSPDSSRARSRARSRSRPQSRSRSRSLEKSRGRSVSRAHSTSRAQSRGRSVGRKRSSSRSVSTSSTSSSRSSSLAKKPDEFKELDMARRRKELEALLNRPTKSILKKRVDSEDSPVSVQNIESPRVPLDSATMSREAERFLTAVKGMEPSMLASMLGELRDDPHMVQSASLNPALSGILGLLEGVAGQQDEKKDTDIEDEEKFLYGDEDDSTERSRPPIEAPQQSEVYGDTENALYEDSASHHDVLKKEYCAPGVAQPHLLGQAASGDHASRGHQQQVDMRYHSRSSITPDQNIRIEVPNLGYPPGTGPLEENERHEVEEYEKIQDLLKTIGLDLGVTEISKMAARTQERLHGKKPPPKTPTRRPEKRRHRDSSDSSDSGGYHRRRKTHSRSGSSSSSSRSRSLSSDSGCKKRKKSPPSNRGRGHGKAQSSKEKSVSESVPQSSDPKAMMAHPAHAMSAYPQAQPHGLIAPNYPPPGYGQYGNYMPYMPQQWPLYPPPSMSIPPQSPNEDVLSAPPFDRTYLQSVQTSESDIKGNGKGSSRAGSSHERRGSEEKNNESQKQKVLEEREKLRQDRDIRMKKKEYLMKELERLRKQQGELLRKKRREKDGHKDPLLTEISRLQEEVISQISVLRKEHEAAEKKRSEIDKVAVILGLSASDKPQKVSRAAGNLEQPVTAEKKEPVGIPEKSTSSKMSSSSRALPDKQKQNSSAPPSVIPNNLFEYYDAGNHWCQHCNVTSGSMFDFFTHLHSKLHKKTQDPYSRPWAPSSTKNEKNDSSGEKMVKPAKGSELLLPVRGFFCQLCEEFYGDAICAEEHVTSHMHNEKYKKQMYENPLYEQRRNLDRQAGLNLEGGKKIKLKHEQQNRDSVEKEDKHNKKKDEEKSKPKKKEEKKDDERPNVGKKEEEKLLYNKKDEDDKNKCFAKEESDRYKYSKEMEERSKHSKREEEYRYKYGKEEERYPYRREDDNLYKHHREEDERSRCGRGDERPKHSWRDDDSEERVRYNRGKESRSKYDRKEEEKYRFEKEKGKPNEDGLSKKDKAGHSRPEETSGSKKQSEKPAEKLSEPPKIICGPSPAMRAKLRKKSEDATKGVPAAPVAFGKFSWKKKESELAKEAERVAAEFLKDEEAKEAERQDGDEDPYSKSVAIAKSIAVKLSGTAVIPNTWVPYQSNRGRIRPNLPAPSMVLRKSVGEFSKPAPLNAFLSIRPPSAGTVPPMSVTENQPTIDPMLPQDIISKAFGGQEVVLNPPDEFVSPILSVPLDVMDTKDEPSTNMSMLIMMESDVGAPGVPECEQNRAVLVQPPPLMARYQPEVQKSDKPKSNLAAAKAQDLFDIFYSSSVPSHTSTVTKLSGSKNKEPVESVALKTLKAQPQAKLQTEPQSSPLPKTEAQSTPLSQTEPQSILQSQPEPKCELQFHPLPQPELQLQPEPQPQLHPGLAHENCTSAEIGIRDPKECESGLGSEIKDTLANDDPSAEPMEITTEALGLPADVLTLDFDYNFSFE